jgi:hypothetical protein
MRQRVLPAPRHAEHPKGKPKSFQENNDNFMAMQLPWVQEVMPARQTSREAVTPEFAKLIRCLVSAGASQTALSRAINTMRHEEHAQFELLFEEVRAGYGRQSTLFHRASMKVS